MMGFGDDSGMSWTISKQSVPRSRHITTPTPHHSIFTGQMLFLTPNEQCQSTEGTRITDGTMAAGYKQSCTMQVKLVGRSLLLNHTSGDRCSSAVVALYS